MADQIYNNKKQIITNILIVFVISYGLPILVTLILYIYPYPDEYKIIPLIIIPIIQIILSLGCYIYLIRNKNAANDFDKSYINISISEFVYFAFLVIGLLLTNALVAAIMLKMGFSVNKEKVKFLSRYIVFFLMIKGSVVSPIVEELIWRGYIQWNLRKVFGPKAALIGQAIGFSLLHYVLGPIGIASAFLRGILFGLWREKRRTLLPLILAHIIVNTLYYSIILQKLLIMWGERG